jgi:poly(A) polymerase
MTGGVMDSFKNRLTELFDKNPELQILKKTFLDHQADAWLVGGSLRDLLLARVVEDVDIAVAGDPTPLAQSWAQQVEGRWFWLDQERLQSRVLLPSQMIVDFAPLRATTLIGDLVLRDFTINALALPLAGEFSSSAIVDPLGGLNDLEQRLLRFCSTRSIADDPLRMLKGIRHLVSLQMSLDGAARRQIEAEAGTIKSIAGERIRDELGRILLSETPVLGFELLLETGLLYELFGTPRDSWNSDQTFTDLQQLDLQIKQYSAEEGGDTLVEEAYSSRSLFLLATFLRDYQPAELNRILHEKLRLSRQQQRIILSLQTEPDNDWVKNVTSAASARQKALLVEALGYFPAEQLIYWSIYRQFLSRDQVFDLLTAYQGQQQLGRVPDLLDGNQMSELLQRSGKEIGVWQKRIKLAELAGEICDSVKAISWLKGKLSD